MKRRWLLLLLLSVSLASCHRAVRYPPLEPLLIDVSAFPEGWSTSRDGPGPLPSGPIGFSGAVQDIGLTFYAHGGHAYEDIERFETDRAAAKRFAKEQRSVFRATEWNPPWQVPEEVNYESVSADQFYYACTQDKGMYWPMCSYIAQYGKYFVRFHTHMIPGYMSNADFEVILQAVDERMSAATSD